MRKLIATVCACAGIIAANAETIDLNNQPRTLTSADDLTSATTYTNTGDTVVDLTITADTAEKLVVDAVIAGNIRVVKAGDGRLRLNAANTYAGGTIWNAGYLEAGTLTAFGVAKTTVTCQTSGDERYFHLLAKGDYDYNFVFNNTNPIRWQTYDGVNVIGDITGNTSSEMMILGDWNPKTFKNINLPNATLAFGAGLLTVTNAVTVKKITAFTCYGKKDWNNKTYEEWTKAGDETRAAAGILHLKASGNSFDSFSGQYAGLSFYAEGGIPERATFSWENACYNSSAIELNGVSQTANYLSGTTSSNGDNYRQIKSTNPATLTLKATQSASTWARVDGAVSIVYDAQDAAYTQAFIGTRNHLTSGKMTAKAGTLELGGETTWANLTGLVALNCATVAVTTAAAAPFDATKLTVKIEGSGAVRTDRALTVRCAKVDGVPLEPDTYTAANCTWVAGAGSVTVKQWELALTSADFEDYADKTITVPTGGAFSIDIAVGEDLPFAGKITGEGSVHVTGAGTLTLTGDNSFSGGLTFDGTGRLYAGSDTAFGAETGVVTMTKPNASLGFKDTASTCSNPICITATTGTSYLRFELATKAKSFDISSAITTTAPTTFVMRDTVGSCNDGECVVNFRGAIDASGKTFGKSQTVYNIDEIMTLNFYGKVACALFYQDTNSWGRGHFHFHAANDIAEVSPSISVFHVHTDGCFTNAVLSGDYKRTGYQAEHGFNFHGHSMEIAGFCTYDYALTDAGIMTLSSSDWPATLTVTGEGVYNAPKDNGGRTTAKLNAGLSLVWAPVLTGPYKGKGILYNSTHATEGTITVATGTLATEGAVKFTNLSGLTVRSGATFELNTTTASALPKLKDLNVEAGGTFKVTAGETPFSDNLTTLYVGDDTASVELPANTTLKVGGLATNGVFVADGTYTPTWLKGTDVKIEVTNKNTWTGPKGGSWGTAANWAVAVPSATQPGYVHAGSAADVQAVVDAAASAGAVEIMTKGGGNATVTVQAPLTVAADKVVTIGDRGTVDVAEGGSLVAGPMTTAGKVEILAGGKLVLGSGDSSVRVNPGTAEHGLVVNAGGELSVTGGTLRVGHTSDTGWARHSILFQKGGDINVSNDAQILLDFGTYSDCDCPYGVFGTGKTVFSGNSKLTYADGTRTQHGPYFTPVNAGETCEVLFTDAATVGHPTKPMGNMFIIGATKGGTARMTFDSTGTSKGGYSTYVGEGLGRGEVYVRRGTFQIDNCGLQLGCGYERYSKTSPFDADGYIEVCGGLLTISVYDSSSYNNHIYGLNLGMGAAVCYQADGVTPVPSKWKGTLKVTDGVSRNGTKVAMVVGSGLGEGHVVQTGGALEHNETAKRYPVVVGFVGGTGDWTMSGGTAVIKSWFYVGGVTTNELGVFVKSNGTKGNDTYRAFPADWHTATGKLALSGGTMTVAKDLVLSADGQGTLELKPGCKLAVAGNLDARTGSKLVVDCRGYAGRSKTLATFGGTTTAFADVEFLKDDAAGYTYKITDKMIRISSNAGGVLLVR